MLVKKLIILLTFIIGLLTGHTAKAQENLIEYSSITFNSDVEKQILDDHFIHKKENFFMLFMANGSLLNQPAIASAQANFYQHLNMLNPEKLAAKKNDKKVKFLYDDIHKAFLAKYELRNRFEEIFYNGYYNCVSASALYGIVFHHYNIPFSIKEKPSHIYLIAYPEAERIMIETTTPASGFISINPQFKQNFVKMLKEQKMISAQEYAAQNVDVLFDKFYFREQEDISLSNLVGIQYMNDGLYKLDEEKYLDALHQFEKAYLFYPSERVGYLMMHSAHNAFEKQVELNDKHAQMLAKLARFKKYGITGEMIQGEFTQVVQKLLFEQGLKDKLAAYYKTFEAILYDSALKIEIEFIYNYENGRLLYNQARYKDATPYFEKALTLKRNHQDTNSIFIASLSQSLQNDSNSDIINSLEEYHAKYPGLRENNIFNTLLATAYLVEFGINFEMGRPVEAEKHKYAFEKFFQERKDLAVESRLIGNAYSAAAVYYFRKGQLSKAKGYIAKGLELAPNNYELLMRKRMIN